MNNNGFTKRTEVERKVLCDLIVTEKDYFEKLYDEIHIKNFTNEQKEYIKKFLQAHYDLGYYQGQLQELIDIKNGWNLLGICKEGKL